MWKAIPVSAVKHHFCDVRYDVIRLTNLPQMCFIPDIVASPTPLLGKLAHTKIVYRNLFGMGGRLGPNGKTK